MIDDDLLVAMVAVEVKQASELPSRPLLAEAIRAAADLIERSNSCAVQIPVGPELLLSFDVEEEMVRT